MRKKRQRRDHWCTSCGWSSNIHTHNIHTHQIFIHTKHSLTKHSLTKHSLAKHSLTKYSYSQSVTKIFISFAPTLLFTGKHVPGGLQSIEHVFCPINGRYRFTYMANNGELHCDQNYSELSNCPHGNALGAKFRQCSFPTIGTFAEKQSFFKLKIKESHH